MMIIKKWIKLIYDNDKLAEYRIKDYTIRGNEVTLFFEDNTKKIFNDVSHYKAYTERRFTK